MHSLQSFLPPFAIIDGIGSSEVVLIFILALMMFGGKKLPELARGLGKSIREFKRAAAGVEDQIKRAIDEAAPPEPPVKRPATTEPPVAKATPPNAPQDFLS